MWITEMIEQKRRYRAYKARVQELPAAYRDVHLAMQRYVYYFSPGKADNLQQLLDDLLDVFDRAAADGTRVAEIIGDDPVEFVEAFIRNYPPSAWIAKERDRLTAAVHRVVGPG